MADKAKTLFKVIPLHILKPVGGMTWDELGKMLREVRYRTYRLANLAVSEAYLGFHLFRTGKAEQFKIDTVGQLSRRLRQMLLDEGVDEKELGRFSTTGALPDTVAGALSQYKIGGIKSPSKWQQVVRGKTSLPVFRADMAVPVRCDKPDYRRLERNETGDVEVELMICRRPYPRVVLATGTLGPGQQAILERLLANKENSEGGYRQRLFEIKQDSTTHQWWLYVTYEFPAPVAPAGHPDIVVGVDLGFSVPLYAAINNGLARLGRREFQALAHRIRTLQSQVITRRRAIQRGGRVRISQPTARSGHGVKRKLLPIEKLRRRIDKSYTTLNHQLSAAVIAFAKNHGAGVIQVEDLSGLQEELRGTFLGARWRYEQLFQFLKYKAEENGITFKTINPKYTSRRCSKCGFIDVGFDRAFRDSNSTDGKPASFVCRECGYKEGPDYNAARNIATIDIEEKIALQCKAQGIT